MKDKLTIIGVFFFSVIVLFVCILVVVVSSTMDKLKMKRETIGRQWQRIYGARRRELDRAILAEVERQIAAEEKEKDEERRRIAAAFGRKL